MLASFIAGDPRRAPPPAGWLVNHLIGQLGLSAQLIKVVLLQGQAPTRDHADRALVFFRTAALKEMAGIAIKDFAKSNNIRGLFAKDVLPASALQDAYRLNATGLALRRVRLATSFRVLNRLSLPVLVLTRPGRTCYEDALPADFMAAAETSTTPMETTSSTTTPAPKKSAVRTGAVKSRDPQTQYPVRKRSHQLTQ